MEQVFQSDAAKNATWRICVWHKNQRAYQTGDKRDETGYDVYDVCRRHGALIFTGHEHSYSRTRLMSNFFTKQMVPTADTTSMGDNNNNNHYQHMDIKPGQTFAAVIGTGGYGIRPWRDGLEKNPWWAVTASADNGLQYGAMLCEFGGPSAAGGGASGVGQGKAARAECRYQDINGRVWDQFSLTSVASGGSGGDDRQQPDGMKPVNVDEDPSAAPLFLDVQLSSPGDLLWFKEDDDDEEEAAMPVPVYNPKTMVLGQRGGFVALQFRNLTIAPYAPLAEVRLQFLALSEGRGRAKIGIQAMLTPYPWDCSSAGDDVAISMVHHINQNRISNSQGATNTNTTTATTIQPTVWWLDDGSEDAREQWESGSVWVSPDLQPIMQPLVSSPQWNGSLAFVVFSDEKAELKQHERRVYGSVDPCLSPSLTVQLK